MGTAETARDAQLHWEHGCNFQRQNLVLLGEGAGMAWGGGIGEVALKDEYDNLLKLHTEEK